MKQLTILIVSLCETRTGYQNLCRLITRTKLRVPKHSESSAQLSELEECASGLICLTGDEHGPLARALQNGGMSAGRKLLDRLTAISPDSRQACAISSQPSRQSNRITSGVTASQEN